MKEEASTQEESRPHDHTVNGDTESSRVSRVTKRTLWVSSKILGIDTIARNAKYMRPRNPRIWSDVFSKKGLHVARHRITHPKLHNPGLRVYASLSLSVGLCLLMFGYSILFLSSHPDINSLRLISKIALVGCATYGLAGAIIYSSIIFIKIKHQTRAKSKVSGGARK